MRGPVALAAKRYALVQLVPHGVQRPSGAAAQSELLVTRYHVVKLDALGRPTSATGRAVGIYDRFARPAPPTSHLAYTLGVFSGVAVRRSAVPFTIRCCPTTCGGAVALEALIAYALGVACITPECSRSSGQLAPTGTAAAGRVDGVLHDPTRSPSAAAPACHGHAVRASQVPQASQGGTVTKQASQRMRRVTGCHHRSPADSGRRTNGDARRGRGCPAQRAC